MIKRRKRKPHGLKVRFRLMQFVVWAQEQLPRVPSPKQIQQRFGLDKNTAVNWLQDWAEIRKGLEQ